MLRSVVIVLVWSLSGLATAQTTPEDEALRFPGGDGVVLVPYQPANSIFARGAFWNISFLRPSGWSISDDGTSWLMEPNPNPGDLGVIVVITAKAEVAARAGATADGGVAWDMLLGGGVGRVEEVGREPAQRTGFGNKYHAVEVVHLRGQFKNGQPARWIAVSWRDGEVFVAALAGASDRAYEPFESLLKDLLLSIQFTPR